LKQPPSNGSFTVQYNSSKVTTQRNNGNSSELNTLTLSNHSKNHVLLSENPKGILQSQRISFNAKSPKTPKQNETDNFKTKMRRYQELQRKVNDLSYQMPSSDYDEDDSAMPQLKADLEQFFKAQNQVKKGPKRSLKRETLSSQTLPSVKMFSEKKKQTRPEPEKEDNETNLGTQNSKIAL
jgi:hypothetical protein